MRSDRQLVATGGNGFGLFRAFRGVPICPRLPLTATARLHKRSIAGASSGAGALRGVGGDKLPRALEVVPRHQDLARAAVAYTVAGACTQVRLAVMAGDSFRPQEAADRLCFHRVSDNHKSLSVHQPPYLAECEHVCLGAGLEERDFQCPLADAVVLAHELVHAAVSEQAVPVLVDVDAV
jgi:hypothetical protein